MTRPEREQREADLSAYLDGELDAARMSEIKTLLAESADVRQLLDELRAVRDHLVALPHATAPDSLAENLARRAERQMGLDESPNVRRARIVRLFARLSAAAAVILAGVFVSWQVFTRPAAIQPQLPEETLRRSEEKGTLARGGTPVGERAETQKLDQERIATMSEMARADKGGPSESRRSGLLAAKSVPPAVTDSDTEYLDFTADVDVDGVADAAGVPILADATTHVAAGAPRAGPPPMMPAEDEVVADAARRADRITAPTAMFFGKSFASAVPESERSSVALYVTPVDAGAYAATAALLDSWSVAPEKSASEDAAAPARMKTPMVPVGGAAIGRGLLSERAAGVGQTYEISTADVYTRIRQVLDVNPRQAVRVETNVDAAGTEVLLAVAQALAADGSESLAKTARPELGRRGRQGGGIGGLRAVDPPSAGREAAERGQDQPRARGRGAGTRRARSEEFAARDEAGGEKDRLRGPPVAALEATPRRSREVRRAPSTPSSAGKTQRPTSPRGYGLPEPAASQSTDAARELMRLAPLPLGLDRTARLFEWLMGTPAASQPAPRETPAAAQRMTASVPEGAGEPVAFRVVLLPPADGGPETRPASQPASAAPSDTPQ